jgi:hypothetical protein
MRMMIQSKTTGEVTVYDSTTHEIGGWLHRSERDLPLDAYNLDNIDNDIDLSEWKILRDENDEEKTYCEQQNAAAKMDTEAWLSTQNPNDLVGPFANLLPTDAPTPEIDKVEARWAGYKTWQEQ